MVFWLSRMDYFYHSSYEKLYNSHVPVLLFQKLRKITEKLDLQISQLDLWKGDIIVSKEAEELCILRFFFHHNIFFKGLKLNLSSSLWIFRGHVCLEIITTNKSREQNERCNDQKISKYCLYSTVFQLSLLYLYFLLKNVNTEKWITKGYRTPCVKDKRKQYI